MFHLYLIFCQNCELNQSSNLIRFFFIWKVKLIIKVNLKYFLIQYCHSHHHWDFFTLNSYLQLLIFFVIFDILKLKSFGKTKSSLNCETCSNDKIKDLKSLFVCLCDHDDHRSHSESFFYSSILLIVQFSVEIQLRQKWQKQDQNNTNFKVDWQRHFIADNFNVKVCHIKKNFQD